MLAPISATVILVVLVAHAHLCIDMIVYVMLNFVSEQRLHALVMLF
jgi:hypothetical protein